MVRIALLSDRLDPALGGGPRWVSAFAAHLGDAGHEVHLVGFDPAPLDLPGRHHPLPDPAWPGARARAVASALARIAPDRVWDGGVGLGADVLQPQTGSEAWSLARFIAAMPPARRLRTTLQPWTILRRAAMAQAERRRCAAAGRIVAMSSLVRDLLVARRGADPARVEVIPNGVPLEALSAERLAPLRDAGRAAAGAGDATLFLLAAHNLRLKGAETALRALALLRAGGADARLLLVGGWPDDALRGLAARLLPPEAVRFAGPVADMAPCYAAADALLHPARWDAFGLVVAEAMAAGLPVIASRQTGAAEHLSEGRSGWTPPETLMSWARRLGGGWPGPARRDRGDHAAEGCLPGSGGEARGSSKPYAVAALLLSQTNRFML